MTDEIRVNIDERVALGKRYWQAIRGEATTVAIPTPCAVREDCGVIITSDIPSAIWYFKKHDSFVEVGILCCLCDRDLVGQAEENAL